MQFLVHKLPRYFCYARLTLELSFKVPLAHVYQPLKSCFVRMGSRAARTSTWQVKSQYKNDER